jgi:hypothetical protein
MIIDNIIITLKRDLIRAFAVLDAWFDKEQGFYFYEPEDQRPHARHILEHIMLTNDHLLSLINNGCKEALKYANSNGENWSIEDYELHSLPMDNPAVDNFIKRLHPGLKKNGSCSFDLVREELRDQLYRALCQLELLRNGEGSLHSMPLSEKTTDKMDIYQLMHLLSGHIWKEMVLLKTLEEEYNQKIEFE